MYHKLSEKNVKKTKIAKNNKQSKKQQQIKMIKKIKMNPILKWIYLSNYK